MEAQGLSCDSSDEILDVASKVPLSIASKIAASAFLHGVYASIYNIVRVLVGDGMWFAKPAGDSRNAITLDGMDGSYVRDQSPGLGDVRAWRPRYVVDPQGLATGDAATDGSMNFGADDFSIRVVLKISSGGSTKYPLGFVDGDGQRHWFVKIASDSRIGFATYSPVLATDETYWATAGLSPGDRAEIEIRKEGTTATLFVNGVEIDDFVCNAEVYNVSAGVLHVAHPYPSAPLPKHDDEMSELQLTNLTTGEVVGDWSFGVEESGDVTPSNLAGGAPVVWSGAPGGFYVLDYLASNPANDYGYAVTNALVDGEGDYIKDQSGAIFLLP